MTGRKATQHDHRWEFSREVWNFVCLVCGEQEAGRDTTAVDEPCLGFDSDGVPFGDCANCGLARGVHPEPAGRKATQHDHRWEFSREVWNFVCLVCGEQEAGREATHGFVSQTSNACACGLMLADCEVASAQADVPGRTDFGYAGRSPSWCGDESRHPAHRGCGGVKWSPSCGRPWSEHERTRDGEPYCSTATCPAGGPVAAGRVTPPAREAT